jgi:ribonuclease E
MAAVAASADAIAETVADSPQGDAGAEGVMRPDGERKRRRRRRRGRGGSRDGREPLVAGAVGTAEAMAGDGEDEAQDDFETEQEATAPAETAYPSTAETQPLPILAEQPGLPVTYEEPGLPVAFESTAAASPPAPQASPPRPEAIPEHPAEESRVAPPPAMQEEESQPTPTFASEALTAASAMTAPEAQADEVVEPEAPEPVPERAESTEAEPELDKPTPVRPTYTVWSSGPSSSSSTYQFGPKDE